MREHQQSFACPVARWLLSFSAGGYALSHRQVIIQGTERSISALTIHQLSRSSSVFANFRNSRVSEHRARNWRATTWPPEPFRVCCLVDLRKPPTVAIADRRHPPLARIPIGSFSAPWLVTRMHICLLCAATISRGSSTACSFNVEHPHWTTADACCSFGTNATLSLISQDHFCRLACFRVTPTPTLVVQRSERRIGRLGFHPVLALEFSGTVGTRRKRHHAERGTSS